MPEIMSEPNLNVFIPGLYEKFLEASAPLPKSTEISGKAVDPLESLLESFAASAQETTQSSSSDSKAGEMLDRVKALVTGDRDRTHGSKVANFSNIAVLWDAYLSVRFAMYGLHGEQGLLIRPQDVCALMILLKVARTLHGEHNPDDWADTAGYAACGFEITEGERE